MPGENGKEGLFNQPGNDGLPGGDTPSGVTITIAHTINGLFEMRIAGGKGQPGGKGGKGGPGGEGQDGGNGDDETNGGSGGNGGKGGKGGKGGRRKRRT